MLLIPWDRGPCVHGPTSERPADPEYDGALLPNAAPKGGPSSARNLITATCTNQGISLSHRSGANLNRNEPPC
jgi:hypothetical protein